MSMLGNAVYTIGHSTHSSEAFVSLLRQHSIEVVADVRSSPFSRFTPQFNKEDIERSLKEHGIRYVFLGRELGARSEDRSCYDDDGRVQYSLLAKTALFQSGLDRVIKGALRYRVALMCAEKEPLECHRTLLVAQALVKHDQSVLHIHADGHLESHDAAMDRLLEMTKEDEPALFWSKDDRLDNALKKQEANIAYVEEESASLTLREDIP